MPVNIRRAKKDDIAAIVEIASQSASAAHWKIEQYECLLETGVILIAESGGMIAGFACANSAIPEWELENIVVAENARRRGIADALLGQLLNACKDRNVASVWLEVRQSNHAASRLYEKHGFRKTGVRKSYYRDPVEDAVLYEWRVESRE